MNSNYTPVSTSGKVSIRSRVGYSFSSSPILTNFALHNAVTGFEIGHSGVGSTHNAVNVTVDRAYSISGPISVYAQNITVSKQLAVISSTASITLNATGFIQSAGAVDLRTSGGDVVLWADSDQSSQGHIQLSSSNTICTAWNTAASTCSLAVGGDIVMGGGAADLFDANRPGGNANGSGTAAPATTGLALGPCVSSNASSVNNSFTTQGGDIVLRGAGTTEKSVSSI